MRPQVGRPADHAAPQARARPDVDVVVADGALDEGIRLHHDVGAEHRVLPEVRTTFDPAVVADHDGTLDAGGRVDVGALPEPDPLADAESIDVDVHALVKHVLVGSEIRLERADVLPVAVDDGADQRKLLLEHGREDVAGEVDDLVGADEVEDAGLEDVDARVGGVGEHLAPARLLEEALDAAVGTGDHDRELEWVLDPLERDRRQRAGVLVSLDDRAQVDVGEHVARDHQERVVELLGRVEDGPGGAERRLLGGVSHPHAEVGPVAEVVPDLVGEERDGDDDVVEAVRREEPHHVLHHRPVRQRHHRLGLVARERPQPRALSPGQDHRFHATILSCDVLPSRSAARACGMYATAA